MIITVCAECPGSNVLSYDEKAFKGELKISHGMCHFHYLNSLVKGMMATEDEVAEHHSMLESKKLVLVYVDRL